jgi:hypothetical protein
MENIKESKDASSSRALRFLLALFKETTKVVMGFNEGAIVKRIEAFRDFMSKDQNMESVGQNRRIFYESVITEARKVCYDLVPFYIFLLIIVKFSEPPADETLSNALTELRHAIFGADRGRLDKASKHRIQGKVIKSKYVDVFITFDEAQTLVESVSGKGESRFIVLRRALSSVSTCPLFTFFLSTTGRITQFLHPQDQDPSNRISNGSCSMPHPYIYLGFDQLMQSCKVFKRWNTLKDVTSLECAAHMGRPL